MEDNDSVEGISPPVDTVTVYSFSIVNVTGILKQLNLHSLRAIEWTNQPFKMLIFGLYEGERIMLDVAVGMKVSFKLCLVSEI